MSQKISVTGQEGRHGMSAFSVDRDGRMAIIENVQPEKFKIQTVAWNVKGDKLATM